MNRARLAVILYADGQTPGQIASQLACPTETVRTCIRRARRRYVAEGRAQSLHRIALRALLVEDGFLAPEVSSHARTMVAMGNERRAALTDAEWRAFQSIPEQGYSHRGWVDARIEERVADELNRVADLLDEPWALWHGDGGVTVEDPQGVYPRPKLTDWLRTRAAAVRYRTPGGSR